jgi:competence protein ComGF
VGKYIYAQNGEDGYKLYRTDKNGKNPVKLNDCSTYFINVVGDYIYYCNGDDEFRIYRMKLDGSDNQQIYDHSVYYLNVENGYMYFSDYDDNRTLYRMTLDGSKNWQLSEIAAEYVNVIGDDAYYCNFDEKTYGIYRVNFVTKKAEKVCSYICGYLNVTDKYLYFTDIQVGLNREGTNKLYCINRDDYSDSREVISSQCGTFTIDDDKIYYVNYDDEDKIYRADLDGQNQVKFVDESAKYVCTAGKRIYYIHVIDNDNFELKNLSFKDCLG